MTAKRTLAAVCALTTALGMLGAGCGKGAAPRAPAEGQEPPASAPAAPLQQQAPAASPADSPTSLDVDEAEADEEDPSSTREAREDFTSVADAEEALLRASREIDTLFAAKGGEGARSKKEAREQPPPGAGAAPLGDDDRDSQCATACRALESMRRASGAVCRLAGDTSSRCERARRLLDESAKRVTSCGCS